jgi:hypothetical protein
MYVASILLTLPSLPKRDRLATPFGNARGPSELVLCYPVHLLLLILNSPIVGFAPWLA